MGACSSNLTEEEREALKASKKLDQQQARERQTDQSLVKLLLLGAGESGKSTIFKQMRQLYGSGFDEESRVQVAPVIRSNLLGGIRTMLENSEKLSIPLTSEESKKAAEVVTCCADDQNITQELADAITTLWKDEQFQQIWNKRASFQLFDCLGDFAAKISEFPKWGGPDWVPSVGDVMKARVRTSGIVEEEYVIDGVTFRMYDVGGQRNERKKWIHCFENVTAVIFVGAISEYDQVLFEDKTMNRLLEAVQLFDEICNSKWFRTTAMILFLNKRDLFETKFCKRRVPLNVTGLEFFETAPSINWDSTSEEEAFDIATQWILEQFLSKAQGQREVYHHITCATDTENVGTVFNASKDIILKANLSRSGFME